MKILTFNWHETYIHLLAKTGFIFDVVERWKGGRYGWISEFRPLPPNCRMITEAEAQSGLDSGTYDSVVGHNMQDFVLISEAPIAKFLVHHNAFSMETGIVDGKNKAEMLEKLRNMFAATSQLTLVFVSSMKRDSWELDGEVIPPGIDLSEYQGYHGDVGKVLRVGNGLKARDGMLGFTVQERVLGGMPSTVLGLNPDIPHSVVPENWEVMKELMKSHRVYLNTTVAPHEDGYNLSMLEAMATGMPVVSLANPSSPIRNGINGYISSDERVLRHAIEELMADQTLAARLGREGRKTVSDVFSVDRFLTSWRRILNVPSYRRSALPKRVDDARGQDCQRTDESSPGGRELQEAGENRDYFSQERRDVEALIPIGVQRVLDVGCGEGLLGKRLLELGATEVTGIEIRPEVCRKAVQNLSDVHCGDIESMPLPFKRGHFDCIVCADVIEHLRDPLAVLRKLRLVLGERGVIIASIPNVRYWGVISMLADGGWTYADSGILDRTHLRFFTRREIEALFVEAGLELTGLTANIDPAYYTIDPLARGISFGRITLRDMSPEDMKDLFVVQYLVRAVKAKVDDKDLNTSVSFASTPSEDARTLQELRGHLVLHPVDMDALVRAAALCIDMGLYDEALESIDRVLLFDHHHGEAWKLKERCHAHKHL